jgi:hypothetical protein
MDDAMTATQFENLDRRLGHVAQILPTLATREELKALEATLRREIREEGERSRRHTTILIEHQDDKINLLIDHVQSLRPGRPGE